MTPPIIDSSNFVAGVDQAFLVIFGISLFFLVAITVVMIYFVIRYRRSKNSVATQIDGNNTLEVIWIAIPTVLVLVMFYYGWAGWHKQEEPPADAMQIKSIARMWNFSFEYANGRVTDTLYVPMNKDVNIDLVSLDVIHSFYIPAFRLKKDIVPGKKQFMWFNSAREGIYDLFCAEYCGLNHSYMITSVMVMPHDKFDAWYADTTKVVDLNQPVNSRLAGQTLVKKMGCIACHSKDGTNLVGPTFKNLFGAQRLVIEKGNEKSLVADDAYLIQSIKDPASQVVKGFGSGLMQPYKAQMSDVEIAQVVDYLKSLSDKK